MISRLFGLLRRSHLSPSHPPISSKLIPSLHIATNDFPRAFASSHDGNNGDNNVKPLRPLRRDDVLVRSCRASGPGGQNVNKVETKIEIRLPLGEIKWIPHEVVQRLRARQQHRINQSDELVITCQEHRQQSANLQDCLDRLNEMVQDAQIPDKVRIATQVPEHEKRKRLDEKRHRSRIKSARSGKSSSIWD
eukprot:TRINITY_DN18816_c0_g1_i1.p1 TRINITY_DN18816_c0_g1~~TRINITY_DN18816_c0_g1_i1.p1  ORF type:complete len:192 (+),score=42.58 TRINITY_DN18816_c0_g1_i1:44-619(+)